MWTQSLHTVDAGHAGGVSSEERSVARWYDDVIEIKDLTKWGCCRQGANEKTPQVDGLRRRRRSRGCRDRHTERQTDGIGWQRAYLSAVNCGPGSLRVLV